MIAMDGTQDGRTVLETALTIIAAHEKNTTDGKWLEGLTVHCAPHIAEWDIRQCWAWDDWKTRPLVYEGIRDSGIDIVAERASDGGLVAIQCKSRQIREDGTSASVGKKEMDSFLAMSGDPMWIDRWLITHHDAAITNEAVATAGDNKPFKSVNLRTDIQHQLRHCMDEASDDTNDAQSRNAMQDEAVGRCVATLREHARTDKRARGRLILPCGTGKTRIALRIIHELTEPGQVSAMLCPSIALVSQLRREALQYSAKHVADFRALAVCSDNTVVSDERISLAGNPLADIGGMRSADVKGDVTTQPEAICRWMDRLVEKGTQRGIIFGTYQSSHQLAAAMKMTGGGAS